MKPRGIPLQAASIYQPLGACGSTVGVTLKQAAWALMFVALYLAVLTGGILAAGLSGVIDFTPESVILLILCGGTAAATLALYVHLIRRDGLSLGGLGFRQLRPRMLHLLWQIPSAIIISACLQSLFLAALTNLGIDSTSAGSSNETLTRIADLPTPLVVLKQPGQALSPGGSATGPTSSRMSPLLVLIRSSLPARRAEKRTLAGGGPGAGESHAGPASLRPGQSRRRRGDRAGPAARRTCRA